MNKPSRCDSARYITVDQATKYYNFSRNTIYKLAKESGALIKYGRTSRVDTFTVDNYLSKEYGV